MFFLELYGDAGVEQRSVGALAADQIRFQTFQAAAMKNGSRTAAEDQGRDSEAVEGRFHSASKICRMVG